MRMGGTENEGVLDKVTSFIAAPIRKAEQAEADRQKPPLWLIALVAFVAWEMTS